MRSARPSRSWLISKNPLKKLEKNGYLTTYSQEFQGRKRKYYSITDSGKEQLVYLNKEWISYRDTIDGIIEGRIRN